MWPIIRDGYFLLILGNLFPYISKKKNSIMKVYHFLHDGFKKVGKQSFGDVL